MFLTYNVFRVVPHSRRTRILLRNLRKGGEKYDQDNNKDRYNGSYNGLTNYHLLVIGY